MSQVVIKFGAFSNISYKYDYETGMTREEWGELSDVERGQIIEDALWEDIDCWDEDE